MTYWENTGKFQTAYDELYRDLVPASGSCETQEGELLRAVSKIYWDFYNNGFGNNWSGALEYLLRFGPILASDHAVLAEFARGRTFNSTYQPSCPVVQTLERVVDDVVAEILSKNGQRTENPCDMFDLQKPDDHGWDDEEEFDSYWNEEDDE